MSAKVSVYIATSLDGFIARKDGKLDWLDAANATVPVKAAKVFIMSPSYGFRSATVDTAREAAGAASVKRS